MASHGLPSLATLRLGAATGMPGTDADGKRPVKALRGEDAEDAAPAEEPEMLLLTNLPRDVIGKIVTQAALDARKAAVPAKAICAWMKHFCTAARMQGVPCDDYWYKLALVTFGVNPDAVAEPPPKWMRGDTKLKKNAKLSWREFFGSLCDALFAKPMNLQIIKEKLVSLNIYNPRQRWLDEDLLELLYDFAAWINRTHHPGAGLGTQGTMPIVKADWGALMRGQYPAYLLSYEFWPLMGLLLLRGAEPFTEDKWLALDHEVYVAIMATKGDALSAPERLSTDEAIRRIADAVARGAKVGVTINSPERRAATLTLTAAIKANNPEIIKWLLDHGAFVGSPRMNIKLQYNYMRQLIDMTVYDVGEWQADWPTTKKLLKHSVKFFKNAKENNEDLFSEAEDILAIALDHMVANGFADDYYPPEDTMNIVDVAEYEGEQVGVGMKAKIYEYWAKIGDAFWPDE